MQVINEQKSAQAPFNWNADIEDYILSNTVIGVGEIVYQAQQERKGDVPQMQSDSAFQAILDERINHSLQFRTLKNYGRVIAENNRIDPRQHDFFLTLTRIDLPAFADRLEPWDKKESMYYRSENMTLDFK